jgi:uncharacterized protein
VPAHGSWSRLAATFGPPGCLPGASRPATPPEPRTWDYEVVRWLELTKSECFELLADEPVGRLALVDDRGPVVLPVNFIVDNHTLLIRSALGTKLDVLARGDKVAFEVDRIDAASGTGWSVLVRGEAIEVTDPEELARLRALPLHPWAPGPKHHFLRILPAVVTGRRIAAVDPAAERGD